MNNAQDYKIVSFIPTHVSEKSQDYFYVEPEQRFAIADNNGVVIDDANGYGYKSSQKARLSLNYKYLGGKEKANKRKSDFRNWIKENPLHKTVIKEFNGWIEACFKEISRGETTYTEIWDRLEEEYSVTIPDFVKKEALK